MNTKYMKYALVAVIGLALASAALGYPILPLDALAGLGAAPLMIGDTVDIKTMLEDLKTSVLARVTPLEKLRGEFDEYKTSVDGELMKLARPGLASAQDNAEAELARKAFFSFLRKGNIDALPDVERKAMMAGSDPDGGYTVPSQIDSQVSKYLREFSPMRQIARVLQVSTPNFHMVHSVGGTDAGWVGEITTRPATVGPQLQSVTPPTGTLYANLPITQQLLDDAGFDIESWLIDEMSEVFHAKEGDAFSNGLGIVNPKGVFTYTVDSTDDGTRDNAKLQYVASGASGAFAASSPADKLIALAYKVKPAYRQNASWLMNSDTLGQIRQFKEATTNAYIWQPSFQAGQPERILGFPVYCDENAPAIAANSLSVAFGDFRRGYTIVDRTTMMLRDPFTNKPYVNLYMTRRMGGCVRDTRAIKFLKMASS